VNPSQAHAWAEVLVGIKGSMLCLPPDSGRQTRCTAFELPVTLNIADLVPFDASVCALRLFLAVFEGACPVCGGIIGALLIQLHTAEAQRSAVCFYR
jgi:hypothetical protein